VRHWFSTTAAQHDLPRWHLPSGLPSFQRGHSNLYVRPHWHLVTCCTLYSARCLLPSVCQKLVADDRFEACAAWRTTMQDAEKLCSGKSTLKMLVVPVLLVTSEGPGALAPPCTLTEAPFRQCSVRDGSSVWFCKHRLGKRDSAGLVARFSSELLHIHVHASAPRPKKCVPGSFCKRAITLGAVECLACAVLESLLVAYEVPSSVYCSCSLI